MKKNFLLFFMAALVLSLSSCSTYRTHLRYNTSPIFSLEETNVTNGILETDLEIVGRVIGSASFDSNKVNPSLKEGSYVVDDNFNFRNKNAFESAKSAALYDAIERSGCDIILAPIYKLNVQTASGGKTYTVYTITVEGFGAKIRNIKQVKE